VIRLALRQAAHERTRFWLGVAGVAAAMALIVTMQSIFEGVGVQLTRYIANSGADLVVMQEGVGNFYLSSSVLPGGAADRVKPVAGVSEVVPILLMPAPIKLESDTENNWIIGLPEDATYGGPWSVVHGLRFPSGDQVIVDEALAAKLKLYLAEHVKLGSRQFTIGGMSTQTSRLGSFMTFGSIDGVRQAFGVPGRVSHLLVRLKPGTIVANARESIKQSMPGLSVWTTAEVMTNDRKLSADMGGDVLRAMTFIALVIGLMSVGLTVFAGVMERLRDYAVMKAIGASPGATFSMVLIQVLGIGLLGWALGSGMMLLLAPVASHLSPVLMVVRAGPLLQDLGFCLGITLAAALPPWLRVIRADPMTAFQ